MAFIFLTVSENTGELELSIDRVVVANTNDSVMARLKTLDSVFYRSSSLDFPDEYTENQDTLNICALLNK